MRLCLPARMGGGGKAESTPWRGPAGAQRPPHGGAILLWEREGKALGVPTPSNERRRSASLSRSAAQVTAPLHGATPTGDVAASRAPTRPVRHRRSSASRSECAAGVRTARREARAPAGQRKVSAPSRSAAGKSATAKKSRSFSRAPDHHPKGQDYRLGARSA